MDKLQVFISWSGERSLEIAKQLKIWLPDVVRNAEPWLSNEDLRKGLQWLPELNKSLNSTGFGISVLTAENKNSPWLIFEAGIISKALPDKHCCPLLCDLKQSDVSGPLANFQSTVLLDKEDMLKLVKTMNDASGNSKVEDERMHRWFTGSWDEFSRKATTTLTAKNTAPSAAAKAGPTDRELLEETLQTVRRLAIEPRMRMEEWMRGTSDGPIVVPPELILREFSRLRPRSQEMLFEMMSHGRGEPELEEMMRYFRHRVPDRRRDADPKETTKDSGKEEKKPDKQ